MNNYIDYNFFLRYNFPKISKQNFELLLMNVDELFDLLSNDELNVKSEELIFDVITKWVDVSPHSRYRVKHS